MDGPAKKPRAPEPSGRVTQGDGRGPVRTCIGCRRRDSQAALVRIVALPDPAPVVSASDDTGRCGDIRTTSARVALDPARRTPGRGAHLHPDPSCVERAVTRRAIPRALRLTGSVDLSEVTTWAEGLAASDRQTEGQDMEAGHTR